MTKKQPTHNTIIRVPQDLWEILEKASFYGKLSINKIMVEAISTRKTFIEKKYLKHVDKA